MVDQLPQEARFLSTHGHTRVLIVGIHWPSWVNDGKPYAAEKLLRDLTLVQQVLATLHWPDSPPEVLDAIDRMVNAVAYTPTVKADITSSTCRTASTRRWTAMASPKRTSCAWAKASLGRC